jgi:hypothetical protein
MPLTWLFANWKLIGIAALLAVLGLQTVRVAELKQDAAERRAVDAESQRLAERAQRTEEQRRTAAIAQGFKMLSLQFKPKLVMLLLCLTAGCSSPPSATSVEPARIPPLPPEARQPPTPSWCLPTCSAALSRERMTWRSLLENEAQPAPSASALTTR